MLLMMSLTCGDVPLCPASWRRDEKEDSWTDRWSHDHESASSIASGPPCTPTPAGVYYKHVLWYYKHVLSHCKHVSTCIYIYICIQTEAQIKVQADIHRACISTCCVRRACISTCCVHRVCISTLASCWSNRKHHGEWTDLIDSSYEHKKKAASTRSTGATQGQTSVDNKFMNRWRVLNVIPTV